ncbi:MAG TPA: hypothetical protein VHK67_01120 [Rhabdochlamydiaceae bacterium]|jgi:hypothetical protein|nr:hypothetical protein [Rhabdochlamydiaceae bacterium]
MRKRIALFVCSVHLLLIFLLCFSPVKKPLSPKKHIAVRTIQPKTRASTAAPRTYSTRESSPPKPKATAKNKPTAPSKPAPVKSKPLQQKKPALIEKKVEKDKPKKKKTPDKVWKEIDEALAKIDDKVYSKPQSKLDVPKIKGSSPSKIPFPDFEGGDPGNEELLASFLHTSLNLPEIGEVKIQLTLKKDGTVGHLHVLQAESQKNKAYLEKQLPLLKFPLLLDKEKTFTFTFCNEI